MGSSLDLTGFIIQYMSCNIPGSNAFLSTHHQQHHVEGEIHEDLSCFDESSLRPLRGVD